MFVQIIEYETDRADEMAAEMDSRMAEAQQSGQQMPGRMMVTRDRDNPQRYMVIVEFPSYEEAMANSKRPDTGEMAKLMSSMVSGGPIYHNLDVMEARG